MTKRESEPLAIITQSFINYVVSIDNNWFFHFNNYRLKSIALGLSLEINSLHSITFNAATGLKVF